MIFISQNFCHYGCGQKAIHQTKKGTYVCAYRPAGCSSILAKMRSTTMERYGVENASSLESVKCIRREKAFEKYGVDNVSKAESVKKVLSEQRSDYWAEVYKNKKFTVDGLTRNQYSRRCHQYAETQYYRHQQLIDPDNKRSKHWHVDHIYSVTDGFLNDVPINVVSDISNLRLISDQDNYKKHKKSDKTLDQLYEDYDLVSSS